ncbi:TetR/AcrR family transcriptional regulator [Novosphingobium sp. ZN18A2]|uniref:TetR/AcrR family transcriptional regulator n=1 Tax=Novosphingobium sp. ZN18A2 TaxID=3079861 RepID=UPI0030D3FDDC
MPLTTSDNDAARERLVEIAHAIVDERGDQGLTMNELAARAGVSPVTLARYFENKEALIEAIAEHWFRPKVAVMEEVINSDLPPRRKMYEFYARRFVMMRDSWREDPLSFKMSVELGEAHFELVRSYVDLGDHYLGMIIAEAMADGHFEGLEIDEAISLVNQMVSVYCNIGAMLPVMERLSEEKLARIVDAMFDGLSARDRGARGIKGLRAA